MALKLSLTSYTTPIVSALLSERGIIRGTENVADVFERVLSTLVSADQRFRPDQRRDDTFLTELATLMEKRVIVLGTPLLAGLGRPGELPVASSILTMPVSNGAVEWERLLSNVTAYLSAGIGIGVDLTAVTDPIDFDNVRLGA